MADDDNDEAFRYLFGQLKAGMSWDDAAFLTEVNFGVRPTKAAAYNWMRRQID